MPLNRIKNKLVADCSQCDALCCNAPEFETPNYKKEAGVTCKNLNKQSLKCQIYDTRELHGYKFCLKFDCHGAGQAVTKLFRDLGLDWRDNKTIAKIQYDIFITTYHYLSHHFFPDSKVGSKVNQNITEKLTPFIDKAIDVLEHQLNESLRYHINNTINRIQNKLVADCSQCDALCCNTSEFEIPNYKKEAGVTCKNLNKQSLKCQIYDTRELHGYKFCLKFDCHGAGQAVTKLFRDLGLDWRDNKTIAKIQYDIFITTYHYLSHHFFRDRKVHGQTNQNTTEKLTPFIDKAIEGLGDKLGETL